MADLRTTVTEVGTGLGALGFDDIERGLAARPQEMLGVDEEVWDTLLRAWKDGRHIDVFVASSMNGRAFLEADDGLRGRRPRIVEWTGAHRSIGDEAVPADLRVDHVYLVSCKYLSRIVVNASPHYLFDRLLGGGQGQRGDDWFRTVAPQAHAALFDCVRAGIDADLPENANALDAAQRRALSTALKGGWPPGGAEAYAHLVEVVSQASAARWMHNIATTGASEKLLWRLLRMTSTPYFVLGSSAAGFLRLRIATPWDWRQHFELRAFDVDARPGGQPIVQWRAHVRERRTNVTTTVDGHVEIRWSHGRFCGPPEAKVYLDTPHAQVPGYFPLT